MNKLSLVYILSTALCTSCYFDMASLVDPSERYVVAIGKTGCGKSSLCNKIIGKKRFYAAASVSSVTKDVTHHRTHFERDGEATYVTMFDTMGLFDTGALSNAEIMKRVKKYANTHAPSGINLILFLFRKGRYTPEEKAAFDFIVKRFGKEISGISALVITHCDLDSEAVRKSIVDDFRRNEVTREVANFMKKGIYTVGFPDESATIPPIIRAMEDQMENDKRKVINLIEQSNTSVLADELYDSMWWLRCTIL